MDIRDETSPVCEAPPAAYRASLSQLLANPLIWLAVALLLTALLYVPGLRGTFVFDDAANIVENTGVHVTSLDWHVWMRAAWSSPSSELRRPLASLSFALNYYFSGLDPWPMKTVNVAIHLLNGLLLFLLLRQILTLMEMRSTAAATVPATYEVSQRNLWLALLVTTAWLLHPINLTAVLYVVQRMESLAQVFVLSGLLFYISSRRRQLSGLHAGWRLWLAVPVCALLGIASKESAALLPVYALLLEVAVLGATHRKRSQQKEIGAFYAVFLLVPATIGLAWLLPKVLSQDAYATRPFTLVERLLTEPRVVMDYAGWILLPLPRWFSLYHDDYSFSTDLMHPWTTPFGLLGIITLVIGSLLLRQKRPLIALGILWFLSAQALTATVIALDLVYDHRNYFGSIGLLLAAFDLLLPNETNGKFPDARRALIAAMIALCIFTTALRVREWANPVEFAVVEAARHPNSARATYELGRTLVVLSGYRPDSKLLPQAFTALEQAMRIRNSAITPEVALITLAARTGRPIKQDWWISMQRKLHDEAPKYDNADALTSLSICVEQGYCHLDPNAMLQTFYAALSHQPPRPGILTAYAIYAFNGLHDGELALRLANDAVAQAPHEPQYRINLAYLLIGLDRLTDAQQEINTLHSLNYLGRLNPDIVELEQRIHQTSTSSAPIKSFTDRIR